MTVLLFLPGATRPGDVAKVPTTDAAARSVEREAGQLAQVGSRRSARWSRTIPKVIATVEHLGRPVLVMTAVPWGVDAADTTPGGIRPGSRR